MSNNLYKKRAAAALKGQLWNPLPGNRGIGIGVDYGLTKQPSSNGMRYHKGIDMHAPLNGTRDKVYAPADGIVVHPRTGMLSWHYGNAVMIRHVISGITFWTIMAHCRRVIVRNGQSVQGNQHIAWEGATGNTGSNKALHVHFEVRVGKNDRHHTIDPIPTIKNPPRPLFFRQAIRRVPNQAEMDKIANEVGQKMLKQQQKMLNNTFKQGLADLEALDI